MLLVYAMTRATQHGWATAETIGLLVGVRGADRVVLPDRARSKAPLLPLRIFRLRTLTASNVSGLLMRRRDLRAVLPAHALHAAGAALLGAQDRRRVHRLTLTIIVFSAVAQASSTRIGVRRVLPVGLALDGRPGVFAHCRSRRLLLRPVPRSCISGLGLALAFVPMSIGALTGVRPRTPERLGADRHEPADRRSDRRRRWRRRSRRRPRTT